MFKIGEVPQLRLISRQPPHASSRVFPDETDGPFEGLRPAPVKTRLWSCAPSIAAALPLSR